MQLLYFLLLALLFKWLLQFICLWMTYNWPLCSDVFTTSCMLLKMRISLFHIKKCKFIECKSTLVFLQILYISTRAIAINYIFFWKCIKNIMLNYFAYNSWMPEIGTDWRFEFCRFLTVTKQTIKKDFF